jgi:phosphate transport system substrate-binding protein
LGAFWEHLVSFIAVSILKTTCFDTPRLHETPPIPMKTPSLPSLCILTALFAVASPALRAQTQPDNAAGIYMQNQRADHMAPLKHTIYYTGLEFDLAQLPHYKPRENVSGTLKVWGLNYLGDCMLADYWKAGFEKYQPGVTVEYRLPVAMLATSGLCTGTCDIGANRRATFTELLQFERIFNYDMFEVPLASGGLDSGSWSEAMCIIVNNGNPISKLSTKQLDGVFGAARDGGWASTSWHAEPPYSRGPEENIRTWGQLGLTGEWADKRIHPHAPCVRYDTETKFSDAIIYSSDKWNEDTHMYGNFVQPDGKIAAWFVGVLHGVSTDKYAIGIMGHATIGTKAKVVAIQGKPGGPYVMPTWETVQSREYPLIQANYFYINRKPGQPVEPKVREFLAYTLSQEGQREVARDAHYTPLNAELVKAALKSLE